ncbi:bacteriocin immunity protein [Clostridium intestinale]|uniref:bacteriocin immunity protein n=1 Tax=Clostridium intestinale TaxID=36845 RepID=UPI002DD6678D|nr:bacteriocin immunity protein [Clostridium intestinale]WRY52819.1 bacteriocin immunity protein [Clostridium intestinale]
MKEKLTKNELVEIVERIINTEGTEEEIDEMIEVFERNVPHPAALDLIFYPEKNEVTPEEIVEEALNYIAQIL